jgi:hypothetical protein
MKYSIDEFIDAVAGLKGQKAIDILLFFGKDHEITEDNGAVISEMKSVYHKPEVIAEGTPNDGCDSCKINL